MSTQIKTRQQFYTAMYRAAVENYSTLSIRNLKRRICFMQSAAKNRLEISNFIGRIERLNNQHLSVSAKMLGVIDWPYIHNMWDVKTKLNKLAVHYEILSKTFSQLTQINKNYKVIDFNHVSNQVSIELDQAPWFIREGELVLNVFRDGLRVASMAFTLSDVDNEVVAYIGAVQGIHSGIPSDESLEIYKILTKDFEGLRPRSLLLEALKVVLAQLNVKKMWGVAEQHRHHRHKYFSHNINAVSLKNDYNVFWEEHEGVLDQASGFYALPIALSIKDMSEIVSKKRSMYKRRYEIIEYLKSNIDLRNTSV